MKPTHLAPVADTAHALALELYRFTARWPESEEDGLTLEVRRAGRELARCLNETGARLRGRALRRAVARARGRHTALAYLIRLATDLGYRKLSSSGKVDQLMERLALDLDTLARETRSDPDTVVAVAGVSAGAFARADRIGSGKVANEDHRAAWKGHYR